MAFSPLILLFIPPPSQEQLSNGDFSLMTTHLTITGVLQICVAVSFIVLVKGIITRQMDKHIYVTAENRARNLPAKEILIPPGEEAPESRRMTELQVPPPSELEQKVLSMVSERRTNIEIARVLDLSPS